MNAIVIVARHAGLVEWLRRHGVEGRVVAHATADDVRNKVVFGMLPYDLAALTSSMTVVDLPDLRPDQRGKELSSEEMDEAGAKMTTYLVEVRV